MWLKKCNNVEHQRIIISIVEGRSTVLCQFAWCVFWVSEVCHAFSTPHDWLFDIVFTAISSHMLASKVSRRLCREWVVSCCDMDRLYQWYCAFESCTKTWHLQIWCYSFCLVTTLYPLVCDYISCRAIAYHIISFCIRSHNFMSYHVMLFHNVSHTVIPWTF